MIAEIRKCSEELGRAPRKDEFMRRTKISETMIRLRFGNYTRALRQAGVEAAGHYKLLDSKSLFLDWAAVVRKMGGVPTQTEYERHGRFSRTPLLRRFKRWNRVPEGMEAYAETLGLAKEWQDVLELVKAFRHEKKNQATLKYIETGARRVWNDRPIFGPPAMRSAMAHFPVNETGVIYLFGSLAEKLGFMVTQMRTEFPDCEAMREVEPGRWQRVRIEFEYESRNFLKHFHSVKECDVIVCWVHNWPDCPLDVVELRREVENLKQSP